MALSGAQKNKVLQLLGYPGGSIESGSVLYHKVLADRLANVPADTETLVVSILAGVATIETQMAAAPARFISEQVGDIKLNTAEIEKLRKERKLLAREIGQLLDIPMRGGGGISVVC
jgi:hypothetical protein